MDASGKTDAAESKMSPEDIAKTEEFRSIVDDYRDTCLWFAGNVYNLHNRLQIEQVLSSIEANGDMAGYKRAGRIRQWL